MAELHGDGIATGINVRKKLAIIGRPRQGCADKNIVILEDLKEQDAVQMHYKKGGSKLPHYKQQCPNCEGAEEPRPLWYVGSLSNRRLAILELTDVCFASLEAAANAFGRPEELGTCRGLVVQICRADWKASPRILRCDQRLSDAPKWPYHTRTELCRIWGIPIRPRLFKQEEA